MLSPPHNNTQFLQSATQLGNKVTTPSTLYYTTTTNTFHTHINTSRLDKLTTAGSTDNISAGQTSALKTSRYAYSTCSSPANLVACTHWLLARFTTKVRTRSATASLGGEPQRHHGAHALLPFPFWHALHLALSLSSLVITSLPPTSFYHITILTHSFWYAALTYLTLPTFSIAYLASEYIGVQLSFSSILTDQTQTDQ